MCQNLPHNFDDPAGNTVGGGFDGIVGEVGVAGGCLDLGVSELLSDPGKPFAHQPSPAGKTVRQAVNSYITESGPHPDPSLGMLQVGEVASCFAPRDYPEPDRPATSHWPTPVEWSSLIVSA